MEANESVNYRNLPIKGAPHNKGAPIVWRKTTLPKITKMTIVSLIIVRFSIRSQHWNARKLSFVALWIDMTGALIRQITVREHPFFFNRWVGGLWPNECSDFKIIGRKNGVRVKKMHLQNHSACVSLWTPHFVHCILW